MSRLALATGTLLALVAASSAVQVPVGIIDNAFSPDSVQIAPGDSIVWTNNGVNPHTSTSGVSGVPDGLWNSGTLSHGSKFTRGFATSGRFSYYCQFHYMLGMTGVINVGTSGAGEAWEAAESRPGIACSPNPFRSSTTLWIGADLAGPKTVSVFAASGKLVRTLPAARTASWDGRDNRGRETGPGVYFCRCGSGTLAVTRLR
jgi:plastocyanin